MTLSQLEAFVTAALLRTFTAAAVELQMSQPAISDLIRRLETELGVKLFERRGRTLTLTSAGQQLLPHAEQSISAAEEGARAVQSLMSLGGGTATFGLLRNSDLYLRTDLAQRFHVLYPHVRIRLIGQNSAETANDILAGALEAGLVTLPIDAGDLEVVPLARDEIVFVSANPDRVAAPPTIMELCDAPLVLYDAHYARTDPARRQLNERARLAGREIDAVIEVEYLGTALSLVQAGFGDTIACRGAIASEIVPRGLFYCSLAEPMYDTLALVKRKGQVLSPATREMARLAHAAILDYQAADKGTLDLLPASTDQFFR